MSDLSQPGGQQPRPDRLDPGFPEPLGSPAPNGSAGSGTAPPGTAAPPAAAPTPTMLAAPVGSDTSLIDYVGPSAPHLGTGPMVSLEARNVSAWFGGHKVLDRVSLAMQPGRVTALIGPSGCGKSTFLRILNRMHEMVPRRRAGRRGAARTASDIYDPGKRPTDVRRRIGMVFQKPNPFPAMSIYDNVASGLKLAGIKVDEQGRSWWRIACAGPGCGARCSAAADAGRRAVRRPAAAAVHRPVAGGLARTCC